MVSLIFACWLIIYFSSLLTYCLKKETEYDQIFKLGKYSYENVLRRLQLVEKYVGYELVSEKRILKKYKINSQKSRRPFTYYSSYIETFIIDLLIKQEGGNWNFFWRKSHWLNKLHFIYLLLVPISLFITVTIAFEEEELLNQYNLALPFIIAVILGVSAHIIILNVLALGFFTSIFELFDKEYGILNKNITALASITLSRKFYLGGAIILGVGGFLATSLTKAGLYKGLGGGKFGGGGASGSW